jgi:XRE family transcriptional regulator, regulator of sulfur utilization
VTDESFGQRLRRIREGRGLSLSELAERAGMHWNGIAKLERAFSAVPSWDTVQRLAKALGVSCEAFVLDNPAPAPLAGATKPHAGRPPKPKPGEAKPKRPRGRPRKGEG